jgi:hypothetical protein
MDEDLADVFPGGHQTSVIRPRAGVNAPMRRIFAALA